MPLDPPRAEAPARASLASQRRDPRGDDRPDAVMRAFVETLARLAARRAQEARR